MRSTVPGRLFLRGFAAVVLLLIATAGIPGCSSNSSPVGTWTMDVDATKADMAARIKSQVASGKLPQDKVTLALGMSEMITSLDVTLTFNPNRTLVFSMKMQGAGDAETKKGTWKADGPDLTLQLDGEQNSGHGHVNGDTLVLTGNGSNRSMTFNRN